MLLLDDLPKLDAYLDGLMRRTSYRHAIALKPLVQILFTACWAQRQGPVSVRTYNGLPANMARWTSRNTGRTYTVLHQSGDIVVRHHGSTVATFNGATPLTAVPGLVAAL
jgi:hypothetical protein